MCVELSREKACPTVHFVRFLLVWEGVFKEACFLWVLFVSVSDACVGVNPGVCKFGSVCLPEEINACTSLYAPK